ncbi:DNA-(apurinic or apyrimidinic site) lyase [Plasmodiophora brassicae]|uniref:DNA-(apurinic or apyrimidinic site) lyase n=1 Tax=Plasmodiophora brassicae TaxID=37360 RepID=A0A0G4IIF4_PLABS|nr:hypothetical protein PBRA_003806 [Plasmodiophora brassicae]
MRGRLSCVAAAQWTGWLPVGIPAAQFWCLGTFTNGQAFGWRQSASPPDDVFTGVLNGRVIQVAQSAAVIDDARFRIALLEGECCEESTSTARRVLHDFLRASVDVGSLFRVWSGADARLERLPARFSGIRLLRQDPVECLFSFICSSNNNIARITTMLDRLRDQYGDPVAIVDGVEHRRFPTVDVLANVSVDELKALGFGYRAKFVRETARILAQERCAGFLDGLRSRPAEDVRAELVKFVGVGRKVADCVALFSLDQLHIVPVDTHVLQIALRDYRHRFESPRPKQGATVTDRLYSQIADMFAKLYGDHAGWAHSILFAADLPAFQAFLERNVAPKLLDANVEPSKTPNRKRNGEHASGEGSRRRRLRSS